MSPSTQALRWHQNHFRCEPGDPVRRLAAGIPHRSPRCEVWWASHRDRSLFSKESAVCVASHRDLSSFSKVLTFRWPSDRDRSLFSKESAVWVASHRDLLSFSKVVTCSVAERLGPLIVLQGGDRFRGRGPGPLIRAGPTRAGLHSPSRGASLRHTRPFQARPGKAARGNAPGGFPVVGARRPQARLGPPGGLA